LWTAKNKDIMLHLAYVSSPYLSNPTALLLAAIYRDPGAHP
jgi:hypothetical protein